MRVSFDMSLALLLLIGRCCAGDRVYCKNGRIILEGSSAHTTVLTQTGLDSDPWLSPDGRDVVFLRHPADDIFRTSVYEIDVGGGDPKLLYRGPAKYEGRESSYFGRPELNESRDTLFLISKEYATEGSLIAVQLSNGQVRLISDRVVGYDVVECSQYRGDIVALKRQEDILNRPYFLYWLYSRSGGDLGLAGGDELDTSVLRGCGNEGPPPLPLGPSAAIAPPSADTVRVEGTVMESRLVVRVEPTYSTKARSEHIQGDVLLQIRVGADGAVQEVGLVSGPPQLAGAAIAAVRQWRYRPMASTERPVAVVTTVKVAFRLPTADR
jgi:TonB family protein